MPLRIFNMSAKVLTIGPKSDLFELHEVKVLRNVDPVAEDEQIVNVNQQLVAKEYNSTQELPPGITLHLTTEQTEQLRAFLFKWKHVFSTGVTDCDLVKHEINLSDEKSHTDGYHHHGFKKSEGTFKRDVG